MTYTLKQAEEIIKKYSPKIGQSITHKGMLPPSILDDIEKEKTKADDLYNIVFTFRGQKRPFQEYYPSVVSKWHVDK